MSGHRAWRDIREHGQRLRDVARRTLEEDVTQPSLRERAKASGGHRPPERQARPDGPEAVIEFEVGDDPEAESVKVAWHRVIRFCRALSKGSTARVNTKGGGSYEYKYRGADDVVSLAGAAIREFGIMITPVEIKSEHRVTGQATWCKVEVTYEITAIGDDKGVIRGVSQGEAIDFGDKALAKALTQCFRIFLTTALSLPTYDVSMDSDASNVQRPAPPTPEELRDNMMQTTDKQRLLAIRGELQRDAALASVQVDVPWEGGKRMTLWDLNTLRGKQLREPAPGEGDGQPTPTV